MKIRERKSIYFTWTSNVKGEMKTEDRKGRLAMLTYQKREESKIDEERNAKTLLFDKQA